MRVLLSADAINAFDSSFKRSTDPTVTQKVALAEIFAQMETDIQSQRVATESRITSGLALLGKLGIPIPAPVPGQTLADRAEQLALATIRNEPPPGT
jgi:hypothetical protein